MRSTLIKVRNIILHVLFLLVLFAGSVLFFSRMFNQAAPDEAQTMSQSTFPLVSMVRNDVAFNCLHGYSREMDVRYLRDCVTPLNADRQIGIRVQNFASSVDSISYEVLTLDGSRTLENTQVIKLERDNDYVNATLQLQNQMLMDQEYVLKLNVTSAGRSIYYYTNVVLSDGLHTDEYLNFVTGFCEKTVNRTDLNSVAAAVEPDETTDEEATLSFMDIHDSVPQLTWAELNPQIYYKPTPRIRQINRNTGSLTMEYRIAAVNEEGVTEVFNVTAYYRVRFTDSRVFLLNFERTTDEIFNPENSVLEESGIRLGITGKEVTYKADEKGRVVAFVQENELWTYERATSKLTQVFSFPQKENMDSRDFYNRHEIRILRVSTKGDVWFTVTGYMNRGQHEGDNGILLCRYDVATDMAEEKLFVQSMLPYELLSRNTESLSYVTQDESAFCFYEEGNLYRIDLNTREVQVLGETIPYDCYAGSSSGQYFAWLEEGLPCASSTLNIINLENGEVRTRTADAGEKIRPVAFMNDDLVYGLAKDADLSAGNLSMGYFPMYRLVILSTEGEELKTYEPGDCVITDVKQSDHMLSLTRYVPAGGGIYSPGSSDEIMDTATAESVAMGSATKATARKQTIVYLRVGAQISDTSPDIVRSKIVKYTTPRTVSIPAAQEREELYYVYGSGRLQSVETRANTALSKGDALLGYVMNTQQQYVWIRGNRETSTDIALDKLPEVFRNVVSDSSALAGGIDGTVLDLSGCTLDQVLYFVSKGLPVWVYTLEGARTIVGYDEYNTHLLRAGAGEWEYYGIQDSTDLFERSGNLFYTYLPAPVS